MAKSILIFCFIIFTGCFYSIAQKTVSQDSLHRKKKHNPLTLLVPSVLIVGGTLLMLDKDADEFFLSNYEVREERNENFKNFSNHLDDYLQHVPSATTFIMSLAGVKGKHNLPNQAALFIKSEVITLSIVYALKYTVGEARPDTGQRNSFPSGHTAQAFTAATFLAKEYGHKSIFIAIGAYTAATGVGILRVLNDRHWISDVLVGAGIGMLSTEFVYRTHQDRWGKKIKKNTVSINPFSLYGSQGISVCFKL